MSSDHPFASAIAELGEQLGPGEHGGFLVRGTAAQDGSKGAKAVFAWKVGDSFHTGAEFDWDKGKGYSAAGEVAWTF